MSFFLRAILLAYAGGQGLAHAFSLMSTWSDLARAAAHLEPGKAPAKKAAAVLTRRCGDQCYLLRIDAVIPDGVANKAKEKAKAKGLPNWQALVFPTDRKAVLHGLWPTGNKWGTAVSKASGQTYDAYCIASHGRYNMQMTFTDILPAPLVRDMTTWAPGFTNEDGFNRNWYEQWEKHGRCALTDLAVELPRQKEDFDPPLDKAISQSGIPEGDFDGPVPYFSEMIRKTAEKMQDCRDKVALGIMQCRYCWALGGRNNRVGEEVMCPP